MRIDTNQNVGIGTNSPTEKLHVFKDGTAMIKVDSGSSSSPYKAGIEFLRSSVNGYTLRLDNPEWIKESMFYDSYDLFMTMFYVL